MVRMCFSVCIYQLIRSFNTSTNTNKEKPFTKQTIPLISSATERATAMAAGKCSTLLERKGSGRFNPQFY